MYSGCVIWFRPIIRLDRFLYVHKPIYRITENSKEENAASLERTPLLILNTYYIFTYFKSFVIFPCELACSDVDKML